MGITGSIIIFVMIWWIVFFSLLPVGIKSNNQKFRENINGNDPGAPKNPNIFKKFLYSTIITSAIFVGIYYMTNNDYLNIRELLK